MKNINATEFKVKIDEVKCIDEKLKEIANKIKNLKKKKIMKKLKLGDQVVFDYSATVDGKKFEGSEGKDVQIELRKRFIFKRF